MAHGSRVSVLVRFVAFFCVPFGFIESAGAVPVVWTGPTTTFSKVGTADPTLPQNQDRLTDNVWLTRGSIEGMFNIAPGKETAYVRFTSPADTEWATGVMAQNAGKTIAATNWPELTFISWADSYGGPGTLIDNINEENAVVHLISDEIYLDLMFTGFTSSGNFAYQRSTPGISPTGDYNGDGVVNAADYVVWRKTLNLPAIPHGSGADGNSSGTIEAGDYTFWVERFGNDVPLSGGGAGGAAVPESAAVTLALLAMLTSHLFVRRRG